MHGKTDSAAWRWRRSWAERDRSWACRVHACLSRPLLVVPLVTVSVAGDGLLWSLLIPDPDASVARCDDRHRLRLADGWRGLHQTLHAVSFSLVLTHYYPALGWIVWPFTALVALSRVVLGLHYPSDVLAAVGIGWVTAATMFLLL